MTLNLILTLILILTLTLTAVTDERMKVRSEDRSSESTIALLISALLATEGKRMWDGKPAT